MMPQAITKQATGDIVGYSCKLCGLLHTWAIYACRKDMAVSAAWRSANECCNRRCSECDAWSETGWYRTLCRPCMEKRDREKLAATPRVDWDGQCMVSCDGECYYSTLDDAIEAEEIYVHPCKFTPVRIDPDTIHENTVEDHYEDCELHGPEWNAICAAIKLFNEKTTDGSWYPDTSQVIVLDEERFAALVAA